MKRVAAVFVAGALLGASAFAQRQPDGPPGLRHPLLRKMVAAEAQLRYSGVRVVEIRQGADRVRNVEIVLKDGWRTRTEFEAGSPNAGQVIVEDRTRRWHFFPDLNEIHVLPPRRESLLMRLGQLAQRRMKIEEQDGGPIAGRKTRLLVFSDPRGNVVQRLWIDPTNGMALKRELLDPVGTKIGSFEFRQVDLKPSFGDTDFRIQRAGARVVTLQDQIRRISQKLGLKPLRISTKEPYELESVRPIDVAGRRLMLQAYSSDKGRVTLFQTSGSVDGDRLRNLARQGLASYSFVQAGSTFVLVGDVGEAELRRLAGRLTNE